MLQGVGRRCNVLQGFATLGGLQEFARNCKSKFCKLLGGFARFYSIFRFWKRRKTLKKWWRAKEESRNNKKKRFANGIVMMQLLIVVVCFLMRWFFDIGLMRLNLGIGLYLTLLVWAVTLSSNCQRQFPAK